MDSDDSDSDSDNSHPLDMLDAPGEESSSDDDDEEQRFDVILRKIKENDPYYTVLGGSGSYERIQIITDDEWEELGRDISNNTHLENVRLSDGALNDHKMSFLFRGLTRSNTIKAVQLYRNGLSIAGVRSMVSFLQNANNLRELNVSINNIQSEGFNLLFRALRDSPIETLYCNSCGIESIEIDRNNIPKHLKSLDLDGNNINADGCREVATLLQGANATLKTLYLENNQIDDEGVAILVDVLQNNTSLVTLDLKGNGDISDQGQITLLKLVNNISSIQATLQSNHTLRCISVTDFNEEIQTHINVATRINRIYGSNPESAGREKVIQTQLTSVNRVELADLQGVNRSLYSEIDPLHLPEVLSLIGRRHGQGELFDALKTSIIRLFSTVNMKERIQQQRAYHAAKAAEHAAMVAELDAKLVTMEESDRNVTQNMETQSSKSRRV